MIFEGRPVPGGCWVEIVKIYNKDGSELVEDNWRRKLFGRVTMCWIAGGLRQRGAFFKGKIRMENGEPVEIDLDASRWCSTTTTQPVEIEPGVFDFETNTSVYRFRLLTDEEKEKVTAAVEEVVRKELELRFRLMVQMTDPPVGAGEGFPAS